MKNTIGLAKCKIVELPKILDTRGNLTFIEENHHIPFEIKRVYYTYDVPGGEARGGHAHKSQEEFIIAGSGSFDVILDDGFNKKRYHMNRPYYGLYVPNMVWRELDNFSSGSMCLVLASDFFDEKDYMRQYEMFMEAIPTDNKEDGQSSKNITGKNINLRIVELGDAQYILDLRTSNVISKYISRTENDINKQIQWLKDYKIREAENKDYYFIIESKKCQRYGAIRVYDLRADSFSWGSWVIERGSPAHVSIESVLLIYAFGFYKLGFEKCHFEVRKVNKNVAAFHLRFGANIVNEDELTYYFEIDKFAFEKAKLKYNKYL